MTASLFLVVVEYPNFGRTVADPVDLEAFDPAVEVRREFPDGGPVRIWGSRKSGGNHREYERLSAGDRLLFYHEGAYVAAGRVGRKFDSPWVSRTFWGYAPRQLLYSVEDYREVDALPERVNEALGFEEGFVPEGHHGVDDDQAAAVRETYGSLHDFVDALAD